MSPELQSIWPYIQNATWPVAVIVVTLVFGRPLSKLMSDFLSTRIGGGVSNIETNVIERIKSNHLHEVWEAIHALERRNDEFHKNIYDKINDLEKLSANIRVDIGKIQGRLNGHYKE